MPNTMRNEHYDRGILLYDRGLYAEAIPEFKSVIKIYRDKDAPERKLALFYLCESYVNLGLAHLQMKVYGLAEEELKFAIRMHPNYPDLHFHLGLVYYRSWRFRKAKYEFRKALAINPRYARALMYMGLTLLRLGSTGALAFLEEAVSLLPAYRNEELEQALRLYREGEVSRAIPLIEAVADLDVEQITGMLDRALRLMGQGQYADAADILLEAVSICPDYADLRHYLGICYAHEGLLKEATEQLLEALRINPSFVEARLTLAKVRMAEGKREACGS